ncbi:putative cytoplasmic protein [Vibrio vulnificus]|uniref:PDDEXK nuclease domain-containing protein n=1 Tax=Vibrio TaxID=662 RepID=UPI0005EF17C1|nr:MULTISPECIES: PDDEXK nuclease domain-containing protein [Vibrio]KJR23109.1 nuclease [Vibrio sp. S234-5]MBE4605691.1 nuclease [Vibrio navarrensis]OQK62543.1 putative cytoplasmic protein [Vibrio vulnificus]OQK64773.1 putative cytoplasmic protein [Vibrio vulnificus]
MSNLNNLHPLSQEVAALIRSAKQRAAAAINNEITLLYWQVGNRIRQEVLGGERADYGKQVIATLASELTAQYGKGWSKRNLAQMVKFAEVFTDAHIVQTLSAQLSWSHFVILCAIDDPLKRDFYTSMAMQERWSTRTLDERIGALLFERTAISKKPDETIVAELTELRVSGQYNKNLLLKDPYILDFLELNDRYLEKDLEDAILRDIEQFLLELGAGFTFVARQKRIQIDNDDFYIDLLFYNRKLKRLVAIDLKLEKFKHSHKSQMELYLSWLKKYETEEGENPPLGIILCSSKKQEQIELLEMEGSDIHVAEYLTRLIDVELLEQKLQHSIANAKQRLNNQGG